MYLAFDPARDRTRAVEIARQLERAGREVRAPWELETRRPPFVGSLLDRKARTAVRRALSGTAATVLLVGRDTAGVARVRHEIARSLAQCSGIVAVRLHAIVDETGRPDQEGKNPLDRFQVVVGGKLRRLSEVYPLRDWIGDRGPEAVRGWLAEAERVALALRPPANPRGAAGGSAN